MEFRLNFYQTKFGEIK